MPAQHVGEREEIDMENEPLTLTHCRRSIDRSVGELTPELGVPTYVT